MIKALIAEDDITTRKLIVSTLESLDYVVIQCSDGMQAWKVLQDNPDISLIVTDVMMPNLEGRELVKMIRGNNRYDKIPIIIISAVIKVSEISNLLELGASRFIPKPINLSELEEYATALIQESQG